MITFHQTGVQTASVVCVEGGSTTEVDQSTCPAGKKPTITEADNKKCNEEPCNPYIWIKQNGVCSVTCGKGIFLCILQNN